MRPIQKADWLRLLLQVRSKEINLILLKLQKREEFSSILRSTATFGLTSHEGKKATLLPTATFVVVIFRSRMEAGMISAIMLKPTSINKCRSRAFLEILMCSWFLPFSSLFVAGNSLWGLAALYTEQGC